MIIVILIIAILIVVMIVAMKNSRKRKQVTLTQGTCSNTQIVLYLQLCIIEKYHLF